MSLVNSNQKNMQLWLFLHLSNESQMRNYPPVSVTQQNASELSVTFIAFRKSERNVSTFAHCNSCYHFNICIVMLWKERVVDISYIFSGTCLWSNLSVQFAHIFLSIASSLNDVLAEKLSKMNISEPRLSGGRRGSKTRKQPNMLKQNIRSAFKVCDKETGQTGISEYSLLTFLWCFLLQQSKTKLCIAGVSDRCSNCCSAGSSEIISTGTLDKHRSPANCILQLRGTCEKTGCFPSRYSSASSKTFSPLNENKQNMIRLCSKEEIT